MEYSTKDHEYANSSGRVPASFIHCDSAVNFLLQLAHSFSTLLHCFGLQWHSGCIIHTIPLVNFFTALDFNGIAGALDTIFQDFSLFYYPYRQAIHIHSATSHMVRNFLCSLCTLMNILNFTYTVVVTFCGVLHPRNLSQENSVSTCIWYHSTNSVHVHNKYTICTYKYQETSLPTIDRYIPVNITSYCSGYCKTIPVSITS